MRLIEIRIDGFGKFHDYRMALAPGLNVLYGPNEAGKSTLHAFLRAMLFGISKKPERGGGRSLYEKYEPWKQAERYGGSLRVEKNGSIYRISRDFHRSAEHIEILEECTGKPVAEPKAFLSELLSGLTETAYINTISIGQLKSATQKDAAAELKKYIVNLNATGSTELSASAALSYLAEQKKRVEEALSPEAALQYARTAASIKSMEEELSGPENENCLRHYTGIREELRSALSEHAKKKELLSEKIERAKTVLSENSFTDDASIRSYREETASAFSSYRKSKAIGDSRLRAMAGGLLFAAALFCLMVSLCLLSFGNALQLGAASRALAPYGKIVFESLLSPAGIGLWPFSWGLFGGALLLILLAAVWLQNQRQHGQRAKALSQMLSERFQRHAGNAEVSEAALEKLSGRMDGFLRLYEAVLKNEDEKKRLDMEILSLSQKQNSCQEMIEQQQKTAFRVEQKLTELNHLRSRAEELRKVTAENTRLKTEIDAISIAQETLQALEKEVRGSMGACLNAAAGNLISGITGGVYRSMDVGSDLNVYLNTRDGMIPIESVSAGTMDQIYLALRLAAVQLIQKDGEELPLIFDDSFALYDDTRLSHALSFLAAHYRGQVLIFSCHKREEAVLREKNLLYKVVRL